MPRLERDFRFAAFLVLAVSLSACSSGSTDTSGSSTTSTSAPAGTTTSAPDRPAGPVADVSKEITGGNGIFVGEGTTPDLPEMGFVEHEYFASGTATAYKSEGQLTPDGRWTFAPATSAAYRTRIHVRRPADDADFSGTVLLEWNNVSGGVDANPDWASLSAEIARAGHAWVGVTTQLSAVEGGPVLVEAPGAEEVAGKGLKKLDAARYGTLHHPGDGYSFDIYTQLARAVRKGGPALGGAVPERVLAVGESQSAFALTTYYNGVQPLTKAFDGFLVHSRSAGVLPLVGPGEAAGITTAFGTVAALFRTDMDAPVLDIQSEADVDGVLNSVDVRQPDHERFRLWEVAGTAHADRHLLGIIANLVDCGAPINDGPMYLVANAALRRLDEWVRSGIAPPRAPRLEVNADDKIRRDGDGIALGGIRTPPVDVPVAALSGVPGPSSSILCILLGSTQPLPPARIAELYSSRAEYQQKYDTAADAAIEAGFILEEDRAALLGFAEPARIES